jgi:transcriptional regulator with XRE-family HTH domain
MLMSDTRTLGDRLIRLRRDRAMTRGELADRSGVRADVIEKLEHGRRETARVTWLLRIARALRTPPSGLLGRREDRAVRDAVAEPDSRPGLDSDDAGEPPDHGDLRRAVDDAWRAYRSGDLLRAVVTLPGLLGETRLAYEGRGRRAAALLADAHDLAARVLWSIGEPGLAALAAEEALQAAATGDDEPHRTALEGAYCSALLHQGRARFCEDHAVRVAEHTEPVRDDADPRRLAVWGALVLTAVAAASRSPHPGVVPDYVGLARSAATRFDHDRLDYHARFGPSEVATHATRAYALLHEPALALHAATGVHREDLPDAVYGRHLLDVAEAQTQRMDLRAAEATLQEAESLCRDAFRAHGPACALVTTLVEEMAHVSPDLRRMAGSVAVEG